MRRRDAIHVLVAAAAAAAPTLRPARAGDGPRRIATLPDHRTRLFVDMMREFGWTEGVDFVIVRSGVYYGVPPEEQERATKHALEQRPDLIFAVTSDYALIAQRQTATIPIVMVYSGYPVEDGLALSLARPGKNVTGNSQYAGTGVWGKLIQLLTETRPGIERIAVLWGYVPPFIPPQEVAPIMQELHRAEAALHVTLHVEPVTRPQQVAGALAAIESIRPGALFIAGFGVGLQEAPMRKLIMDFAAHNRLPTAGEGSWGVLPPSPLLYYAPLFADQMKSAVTYVDKILRGAKPGDLPIQQPAKLELVISRGAARAIGLTLPASLLVRADRMID